MQGRTLSSHTLEVYTLSRPLAAPLEVEEKGDTYAVYAFTAGPSTSRVRSSPLGSVLLAYRHAHPSSPATILSLQVATSVRRLYAGDTLLEAKACSLAQSECELGHSYTKDRSPAGSASSTSSASRERIAHAFHCCLLSHSMVPRPASCLGATLRLVSYYL